MIVNFSNRTRMIIGVVALALVFFALRLPGIHLPYHQDEWKNVSASATMQSAGQFFAHPPFMQMIFVADYKIFGMENFRVLPLLFSIIAGTLLYLVMKKRGGQTAAAWALILFTVCFYNILGALQPDVDGAILPFLFLAAVYAHDRLPSKKWFVVMIVALMAGLLMKLSFILVVGTIIVDYLWGNRANGLIKKTFSCALGMAIFMALYVGLLYLIQKIYPAYSIHFMLTHANQFAGTGGRDWTQIIVQGMKAVYYLSPLALIPLLFVSKDIFNKTRIFWLYLILGGVFFFGVFDFSRAALDKYLMFAIVPLVSIAGVIFTDVFRDIKASAYKKQNLVALAIGVIVALVLVATNFMPQIVVALYPKTAWFSRVLHGHWNILTPFNGGSGPLGFYVSFLFIAGAYIISLAVAIAAFFKKSWRPAALVIILCIGVVYNSIFAEELLFGKINGSAPTLLAQTTNFIAQNPSISQVLTYNDIGAGPLTIMGKYAGRIYATPDAEDGYRKKFTAFNGQYMIIDIPRFDPAGFYYKFFAQCHVLFQATSGQISGKVYDCPHDPATMSKI